MREEREIEVRPGKKGKGGRAAGGGGVSFFCRGSMWVVAVAFLPAVNP